MSESTDTVCTHFGRYASLTGEWTTRTAGGRRDTPHRPVVRCPLYAARQAGLQWP